MKIYSVSFKKNMLKKMSKNRVLRIFTLRNWVTAAIILVFCPFFSGNAEEIMPLEQIVGNLQRTYEETKDLRADFIQETTTKSVKTTLYEEGIVFFKFPKKMLWEYKSPEPKKMIINHQKAWLYLPREKTAYFQKADNLFQSTALINFLSGMGKIKDDFAVAYGVEPRDQSGNYVLKLTPREKSYNLEKLHITVDKNNFYILQVNFDDVMGNSTLLKFSRISANSGLQDKMFHFQPPAGTSIFEMP